MDSLNTKVENLEAQSRHENLKFYNVPESQKETWEESERKVRHYISETLHMDDTRISIERAHRLPANNKPRPIIVKFSFFKDKDRILQEFKNLKKERRNRGLQGASSAEIGVGEDFPHRISQIRQSLSPFMFDAIKKGKKAYLQYDKLVAGGKRFVFDSETKQPVPLSK